MGRRSKPEVRVPRGWPSEPQVTYLNSPSYSVHLTKHQISTMEAPPDRRNSNTLIESKSHIPPVAIQLIHSESHPANSQRGLFTTCDLAPGAFILFYLGHVHNDICNDHNSEYDLNMDRDEGLAIDATKMGNEARFINDYRGVPGRENKGPNAEFRDCWVKTGTVSSKGWEKRVGVYVLPAGRNGKRMEGIKSGEEVLVNYGKGFWCKVRNKEVNEEEHM